MIQKADLMYKNRKILFFENLLITILIFNSIAGFSQRKVYFLPLDGDLYVYQEPKGKASTAFKADQATDQNGKPNNALAFNGKNTYGLITPPPPLNNYTISIWVKPENVESQFKQSIISAAYMIGKDPCNLYLQNNKIVFKIDDFELSGEVYLQNNKWYHIVIVREPGFLNLFINGKLELQTAFNKNSHDGDPDQIFIGANKVLKATKELTNASDNNFVVNFFKGSLNDLVIVNEALKIEEIIELFKNSNNNILPKEYFDRKAQSINQVNATKPDQVQATDNLPVGGNTALNFDGVDDFVDLPANVGNFANNQPFTVSCWVKPNAAQNKQYGIYTDNDILEKWEGSRAGYPFVIRYLNNNAGPDEGKIVVGRYDGKFNPLLTSKSKINDGRWHHITMVKSVNPFIIKIYIDGNFDSWMNDTCVGVTSNVSKLYIGARGNKINFFNGEIDNIRIWSIDKTIEEIKAEMEDLQPKIENLVAAYNFDDGFPATDNTSKQILRDYLGKNNGTLNNFERKSVNSNFVLSTAITVDKTPPELQILSPFGITNGVKNVIDDKYMVAGRVTDESGVAKVFINGKEEVFDIVSGTFYEEIKIPFGETPIKITVIDKKQNKKDFQFNFKRIIPEFQSEEIFMTNEKRYALVIGNNDYKKTEVLKNPVNDAILISNELRNVGFEVDTVLNGNRSKMFDAIDNFTDKLRADSTATGLFYYAGHGMQVKGNNFLIPIDADIKVESNLERDCIQLNSLLAALKETGNNMNIIILDACRNNPFPDPKKLARGDKIGGGLADIKRLAKGTFIAFATAPGDVALDGVGKNSKYTEELVKAMRTPKLPIEEVFKTVKAEVLKASNDEQQPWESSQLVGKFYFKVK